MQLIRKTGAVRLAAMTSVIVVMLLQHSDIASADVDAQRETFGESPTPLVNDVGGPGGDLVSVNETNGAPTVTIPFSLIPARGGVQPALGLHYSPYADGEAGRGWTLALPAFERKPLYGLPQYAYDPTSSGWSAPQKTDRILFDGAPLVPLCTITSGSCSAVPQEQFAGWLEGWHYFRRLVDSTFQRFFWSPDLRTWRVEDPDGAMHEFGVPLNDSTYAAATDVESYACSPTDCPLSYRPPFRWNIVREWDATGEFNNPVVYRWTSYPLPNGEISRGYLTDIYDTPPTGYRAPPSDFSLWAHHVRLDYEAQPFTVLSGGSELFRWHDYRLSRVAITSKDFGGSSARNEVRMYALSYADALGQASRLNSSYLSTVTPYAMAASGSCVEDASFELPTGCSARALPAEAITYDGINASGTAHACEESGFAGPVNAIFSGLSGSDLEGVYLNALTAVNATSNGLADLYVPKQASLGPFAFSNNVPGTGGLTYSRDEAGAVSAMYKVTNFIETVGKPGADAAIAARVLDQWQSGYIQPSLAVGLGEIGPEATASAGDAAPMNTWLENGATVYHSETATAIGDDPATMQNFSRSRGAAGHDVIVHGGYDEEGEVQFMVNGTPTNVNQIADAVRANPAYTGGPINLAMCHGACGPAEALGQALGAPVNALPGLVDIDPATGLLRQH